MTSPPERLTDRYGAPPAWQRRALVVGVAAVAVLFLGWLAWSAWFHATPPVDSDLSSWDVVDAHTVSAVVQVELDDGVSAHCVISAIAEDHTTVGELTFTPSEGRNEVEIRTERAATSVDLEGCTAPGAPRPR